MKKTSQDSKVNILAPVLYLMFNLNTVSYLSYDHMLSGFIRMMDTLAGVTSVCLSVTLTVFYIGQASLELVYSFHSLWGSGSINMNHW